MSRFTGLVFAACLLAVGTSTSVPATDPDRPKSLTLATASPGGVYYVYGEELAKILTEKLGIPVNPQPTQGTVHNVKLLDSGGAQLGMTTTGVALQGWNGTADWTGGKQIRNMRALFPMYDTPLQALVLRRSRHHGPRTARPETQLTQAPKRAPAATYVPAILKVLGISAVISFGSLDDAATDLPTGHMDAFMTTIGAPAPAIQNIETKEPVTFLSPSSEQIETIRKAMPEFSSSTIAAGTYRSLDKDYVTVGMYNFGVGRADLPDDLVYQLVKAVFENQPRLVKASAVASDTLPQNVVKNTFLPFHPGAVRYYREIGINIPDALVSTN